MKQKFKNYLQLRIFLFGISLCVLGCQKDDDLKVIEHTQEEKNSFKISTIGISKIEDNKLLNSKLNKLTTEINKSRTNNQNKTVYSSEHDFYINTDFATYLESEDATYHSYTFNMVRIVEIDGIENLVFSLNPDGNYDTYVVTYNVSSVEKELIFSGQYVDLTDRISSTSIDNNFNMDDIFSKLDGDDMCIGYDWRDGNECPYVGQHSAANPLGTNDQPCAWLLEDENNQFYASGYVATMVPCDNTATAGNQYTNTNSTSTGNNTSSTGNDNNGQTSNTSNDGTVVTYTTGCSGSNCIEEIDDEFISDCNTLSDLSVSPDFTPKMQELINNTIGNTEIMYYGQTNNNVTTFNSSDRYESLPNQLEINPPPPSNQINCFIHNHYNNGTGTYSTFSGADLYSIFALYNNGQIQSTDNFVAIVTTPGNNVNITTDDTVYAITISNSSDLAAVANIYSSGDELLSALFDENGINANISSELNEQRLAKLLKVKKTGLTLYRGNRNDLTKWTKLKAKNNGTIKEINCN